VGEEKGTGELGRTEGRSSRGQRHGEASVSLAEVGCKRQEGVKGEADDINRDRSLRGYVPCDPAGDASMVVLVSSGSVFKYTVNILSCAY
jgi:hypothetical protein